MIICGIDPGITGAIAIIENDTKHHDVFDPGVKLTEDEAKHIKYQATEPHAVLARRYGVHPSTIRHIRTSRSWRHI